MLLRVRVRAGAGGAAAGDGDHLAGGGPRRVRGGAALLQDRQPLREGDEAAAAREQGRLPDKILPQLFRENHTFTFTFTHF